MKQLSRVFCVLLIATSTLFAGEANEPRLRSDQLPSNLKQDSNVYKEGYLQALIDMHYYEFRIRVKVKGDTVYLSNLPQNRVLAESIVSFVQDFPNVEKVEVDETVVATHEGSEKSKSVMKPAQAVGSEKVSGVWFPQSNILFPALVADPLHVAYSGSLRFNDDVLGNTSAFVSFGDRFPIYRWLDVWPFHGDLELGIEGSAWAYFDMDHNADLVNTDYYAALPLSYAFDNWAMRLRFYHVSAHLGDEYIINNPGVKRVNTSYESLDFFTLYDFSSALRAYAGLGWVFRSDDEDPIDPLYVEGGAELRLLGMKNFFHSLYLQPFYAMHFRFWQDHDWQTDMNFALGLEISKLQNVGRMARTYLVYHDGQSFIGQFSKEQTRYWGVVLSYGF